LLGIKNLAGSFYPAENVYIPVDCLATLPQKEWKSGFAELIKTAVLGGDELMNLLAEIKPDSLSNPINRLSEDNLLKDEKLLKCIEKAVDYKGKIASEDPRESGKRALLNLGHTFGHALEAAAGLGHITHGEAVARGIYQSCALGMELGITPRQRAEKIKSILVSFGYDCASPRPLASSPTFHEALKSDKKKKQGKMTFIVPDEKSARIVTLGNEEDKILEKILKEGFNF
jgi:3-dehydroquinate synthase